MGASCMEEPPIWTSRAIALEDEEVGLVLGAISTVRSLIEDGENERTKPRAFLNPKRLNEEEESNDDSWNTVVFYRQENAQRYAAFGSRPNPRSTRGMHNKCSAKFARQKGDVPSILLDAWQRAHNTDSCSNRKSRPSEDRASSTRSKSWLVRRTKAAS